MQYFKRGDDLDFVARRVRSKLTGALLPAATVTWVLYNSQHTALGNGNVTISDVNTATYSGSIPANVTSAPNLNEECVLDIPIVNAGKKTTLSIRLKAVDILPVFTT